MIDKPRCFSRKCKHFLGVYQPDGTEQGEVVNCEAFPKGIPYQIAYGSDDHLVKHPDQDNDIVFEKE